MLAAVKSDKRARWLALLCGLALLVSCKGKDPSGAPAQEKARDTLILKNGSMVQGVILEENENRVTIRIKGGDIGFPKADVATVRRGEALVTTADGIQPVYAPSEADAPYPRIYLKDGRVASGSNISREAGTFYLKQAVEGGGSISFGFEADKVEKLELWPPPPDDQLDKEFKQLRSFNLKYSSKEPPYYVVSTVESSDLVLYFRTLQQFCSDFSMKFLELIDTEKPAPALGVVIFGSYDDFLKYAGLPRGTNLAGFYIPDKKYLVLFNVKEVDMVRFRLSRAERFEKKVGDVKTKVELYSSTDSAGKWAAYDFLEKIQFKVEADRMRVEGWARDRTMETIRHEAGHQLFDLLGIDSGSVYRGAWLSEGLAEYVSTDPLGDVNKERLMFLRAELELGHSLMPLQYLMSIKNGSGIRKLQDPNYTLLGYAQSWAFVHFLMEKYSEPFLGYIREVMNAGKDYDAQKDIALLEKHVGKSVKELDAEHEKYIRDIMISKLDKDEYDFYRLLQKG
ncbi:MAG TPA: DUF1570 domain-containing protein [Candidatus Omnitrophota bacterium]|nr:DUF1570 domain-containing protein [Candidatus Omnitrophota bacterium]HPS36648.1 DUF1570 domain-containing protein [Candidatus Omnitrophota bacterium]